ncbi:MAG: hypothetical protein NTY98_05105, partial [Verrucomicrobia bacterium]|nr:hypothetical protein [Verrucomicrobiota bacterium]
NKKRIKSQLHKNIYLKDFIGPQRRIARAVEKIAGIPSEPEQGDSMDAAAHDDSTTPERPTEHA